MECVKRADGWWIESPAIEGGACGPYRTKDEAAEDRRGLARFYRDNPGFRADAPSPAPATAPAEPMFSLTRPTEKPARVRDPEIVAPAPAVRTTQKPLFCGLDCLPGQLDLFATDGGPRNG
jgi:hypothetical protein